MRKLLTVAALLVATAVPSVASAQIFLGVRAGYAIPWGEMEKDWDVKDSLKSEIPLQLDLGLKLGKALAVGAYASYAFARPSTDWQDSCDATNADCSAAALRVGAQLALHAANTETTEFWGGLAVGYEQIKFKDSSLSDDITFKGYDATLQGGFDFMMSSDFRIGPFAAVTVGQFSKIKGATEVDITDKAFHGWLQIGLRGFFTL
jgi:hypothetical protein